MPTPASPRRISPSPPQLSDLVAKLNGGSDPEPALVQALEWLCGLPGIEGAAICLGDPEAGGGQALRFQAGRFDPGKIAPLAIGLSVGGDEVGRLEISSAEPFGERGGPALPSGSVPLLALHARSIRQARALARHETFLRCTEPIVSRMAAGHADGELFEVLVRTLAEVFGLDRVSAYAFHNDQHRIAPVAFCETRAADGGGTGFPADPPIDLDEDPRWACLSRAGQLMEIEDIGADEQLPLRWRKLARDRRLGAVLCLPLADRRRVWGMVVLGRARPGPVLSPPDRELTRRLLEQLAPLLQYARVLRQLQENLEALQALLDSSRELAAVLDLWEIPRRVAVKGLELARADECRLWLLDPDGETLRPAFVICEDEAAAQGRTVPLGRGLAGRVAARRQGEHLLRGAVDPEAAGGPTAPRLAVPLASSEELIGVVEFTRIAGSDFNDLDLAMATVFANQAAVAFQNARLFQRVATEKTRLAAMIDQLEEAVLFCDTDDVVLLINPAAHRWLNRSDSVAGERLLDVAPPLLRAELAQAAEALHSGRERNVTREMSGGRRVDLVSLTAIHDSRGRMAGCVVLVKDISSMKVIESQLLQSSKMAAVGQLASGVAHEFNNLIAAIYGYAQLMRDTDDERIRRKGVEIIIASSERARQLTGNLLNFSRDRANQLQAVDLNALIDDTIVLVERQLAVEKIAIVRETSPVPATWAQRGPLQEVLLNLLTNSRHAIQEKAGEAGGTIRLKTESSAGELRVTISDDGIGIPVEHVGRIFEPFFTTKGSLGGRSVPGVGLGLFSVYNVVTAHGGRVEVESEPQRGTTVRVILPLRSEKPAARAA